MFLVRESPHTHVRNRLTRAYHERTPMLSADDDDTPEQSDDPILIIQILEEIENRLRPAAATVQYTRGWPVGYVS